MHSFGRVASVAVLLAGQVLAASPALAQYMFLDANGDGVHDASDVLMAGQATIADVWVVTDRNRDGTVAACATDAAAAMTINSYEVILRAVGGTVAWGTFTNLLPTATTPFGHVATAADFYGGFGGGEILPPGKYHVASVAITPVAGTPSIVFGRSTPLYPPGYTSFGSACVGADQDNTMKLGSDWLHSDGLRGPGASSAPFIADLADQVMLEGEQLTVPVEATDAEGGWIALRVTPQLSFAQYNETQADAGLTRGSLSFQPTYSDSGDYYLSIKADDGQEATERAFQLRVLNRPAPPPAPNPAPELYVQPHVGVQPGLTRDIQVQARDDDANIEVSLADAPPFATFHITAVAPHQRNGVLRLSPGASDVGTWTVVVSASDGISTTLVNLQVIVGPNHPPTFEPFEPIVMMEGEYFPLSFNIIDTDVDPIAFELLNAPGFARVAVSSEPGWSSIAVDLTPAAGDAGTYRIDAVATDGFQQTSHPVLIQVLPVGAVPVTWTTTTALSCLERGSERYVGLTATDGAGRPLRISISEGPTWVAIDAPTIGAASLRVAPPPDAANEVSLVVLRATDASGAWGAKLLKLRPLPPGSCNPVTCGICTAGGVGVKPTAVARGPYHGYIGDPVRLDGRWSKEGSSPPSYGWRFGDGQTARGALVEHRYAAPGHYAAILTVSNADGVSRDTALVVVEEPATARVLVWPVSRVIPLRDRNASLTFRVEPVASSFDPTGLRPDLSYLRAPGMGEADSIGAAESRHVEIGDADGNGTLEAAVSFRMSDLRALLSSIRGKREVPVVLFARTVDGVPVRGTTSLTVLGDPRAEVQVGPNPLNPRGMIRFVVEQPEPVRVSLFDVFGRLVKALLNERRGTVGLREVVVDGRDAAGRPLASGVYFFKIERGARIDRGRVTILK